MSGRKGPNKIREADDFVTSDRMNAVKIRMGRDGIAVRDPISIPGLLTRTATDYPHHPAMVYTDEKNGTVTLSYSQYLDKAQKIAKSFIKLGLEPKHSVGVLAFNSPPWFLSELGATFAGGIIAGIYTTNSAEATAHCLESSHANIVVVDDSKQMEKIRKHWKNLPELKAAIQINGPFESYMKPEDGYYRWSDIEAMNTDDVEDEYKLRFENIAVNECCCLVYTSGTVGNPKGVMLSHDNITWNAYAIGTRLPNIQYGKEVLVSFLPLSHIAAQIVDIVLSITFAATIYFADKDALKGTLVKSLVEARPTRFLGVPRVYEKIYEKMNSVMSQTTGIKRMIANWARSVTLQHWYDRIEGKDTESWQYKLAKVLVTNKVKLALGLDRCYTLASGAAPLASDVKEYFMGMDLPIVEAFGMSESGGAQCLSSPDEFNLHTIGKPLPGVDTMILSPDEQGHGEILMRGRHIFMGYIDDPKKTEEALDNEGWLHTGDVGYIDNKGFAYITGRIKELIITAGGENIPPVHIEQIVKKELPGLSNTMLIGDKKKFLTMLVSIKTMMNLDTGAPFDDLHPDALKWMESLGVKHKKLSEILAAGPCPVVKKSIEEGIIRYNKQAISNAQKIQKFEILPHDFSVPTGELGPTLKVKRSEVIKKYQDIIDKFYDV